MRPVPPVTKNMSGVQAVWTTTGAGGHYDGTALGKGTVFYRSTRFNTAARKAAGWPDSEAPIFAERVGGEQFDQEGHALGWYLVLRSDNDPGDDDSFTGEEEEERDVPSLPVSSRCMENRCRPILPKPM